MSNLHAMSGWIRSTERGPEIVLETLSKVVLAWRPGMEWPEPAYVVLEAGKRRWIWRHELQPTHWMDMPEIPSGEPG